MSKKIYIATAPNGQEFRRQTERTYTHAVVIRPSITYEQARNKERSDANHEFWNVNRHNWDYYFRMSKGRHPHSQWTDDDPEWKRASAMARLEEAKAFIKDNPTEEDHVANLIKAMHEGHQKRVDEGYFDTYRPAGFCGRIDLAEKKQAECQSPRNVEVLILEAVEQ